MGNLNQAQLKLVDFLRQDPRKDNIEIFLVNLLSTKGADTVSEEWWAHLTNLLVSIVTSLEKTQTTKLVRSLETYSIDMRVIAQKERITL